MAYDNNNGGGYRNNDNGGYRNNENGNSGYRRNEGSSSYRSNRPTNNNASGEEKSESVFSKRVKAGKRRTYFFDVKATRNNDYFITITESKKRFDDSGYDRHKMFVYKEDFNKFVAGLNETVNYVKTDLMPNFDFDAFDREDEYQHENEGTERTAYTPADIKVEDNEPNVEEPTASIPPSNADDNSSIDDWKI